MLIEGTDNENDHHGCRHCYGADRRRSGRTEGTDNQFLQAARCRGLASSEGLGQLNTQAVDLLLRTEGYPRPLAVKLSANTKIKAAQTEGDKATGAKKEKLLAERQGACASWLKGGE